jgi:hypothetical protein
LRELQIILVDGGAGDEFIICFSDHVIKMNLLEAITFRNKLSDFINEVQEPVADFLNRHVDTKAQRRIKELEAEIEQLKQSQNAK